MKGRINRQNLQKLERTPASAPKKWLWDTEIPCFGAYRSENNQVSFVYQYRMPGERSIRSKVLGIGGEITLEQARGLAAEMAFQRRQGIDPILEERRKAAEEKARTDLIMANYAAAYLQRRIDAGKPLNKAQTRVIERDIIGNLGDLRIDRMVVEDVEAFGKTMGDRAPSARRMGLVYLKAILNDAKDRGKISVSPALNVDTPLAGKRVRRLREKEIKRFHEAVRDIGDVRSDCLEAILRLGKRKEEVAEMTWEELDLPKQLWFLPPDRTKPGEAFLIELPRQVVEIIARQQPDQRRRHGPVFTLNGRTPTELGSQVKDMVDAGMHRRIELAEGGFGEVDRVAHYTIHDLRIRCSAGTSTRWETSSSACTAGWTMPPPVRSGNGRRSRSAIRRTTAPAASCRRAFSRTSTSTTSPPDRSATGTTMPGGWVFPATTPPTSPRRRGRRADQMVCSMA